MKSSGIFAKNGTLRPLKRRDLGKPFTSTLQKLKCGIVTCGGICPGLNDVIRAIVLSLFYHYGVPTTFGFRYGFEGLSCKYGHAPMELNPDKVKDIHHQGGTILGSSRGPQDISDMVDTLERMNIGILFTIGGRRHASGSPEHSGRDRPPSPEDIGDRNPENDR